MQQQYDNDDLSANDSWSTVNKKKQRNRNVPINKPEMHLTDWCSEPVSNEDNALADTVLWHGAPRSPTHKQSTAAPWDAAFDEQASWDDSAADSTASPTTSAWDTDSSAADACHNAKSTAVSLLPSAKQPTWCSSTSHDHDEHPKQNEDWYDQSVDGQAVAESDAEPDYSNHICHFCQHYGHIQRFCPAYQAANAQPRPKKDFSLHMCYNCGQYGHVAYQCRGPGQVDYPASYHRAVPWNARSNSYAGPSRFTGSCETDTAGTYQHLLSDHNQRYSDAQEPPARSAPASESQQSPSAAPSVTGEPQSLLLPPNRHDPFGDGMLCSERHAHSRPAAQKEQDGWDTSTADPPFAALQMVLPPKPSPARRTPKITADPARHSSAQLSTAAKFQDDMPIAKQDSAWQDSSQHADPVTSRYASQGHPAFPEGIIQPAMGWAPSSSPPTVPVGTSPGQQPVTETLSVALPRPRPQMQRQEQGIPASHSNTGLRPSYRSFVGSQPLVRGPPYEPHRYEQPAYRSAVPIRPHTQQAPSSSGMPAARDERGFRPVGQQSFPSLKPAAVQSSADSDTEACNALTPARAAAEAARRRLHDLVHDDAAGSPGI